MLLLQKIHYRYIYKMIPVFVVGCVLMMLAVRFFGQEYHGATRSIVIAGIPILPAEFMKLGAALGMTWILTRNQDKSRRDVTRKGLWYSLGFMGICAGLLFTQGLSNTIVVVCICYSMMLIGGMSLRKFAFAVALGAAVGGGALWYKMNVKSETSVTEYQAKVAELNKTELGDMRGDGRGITWNSRVKRHFSANKHEEPFSTEYQQELLSFIAQAHGGPFGVGIGRSRENARLPLAYSDYIYAIIIEELGLFVGIGILICYLWILGRSAKLTVCFKHTMPGVLVMGCAFVIVFQALYHMAIVSGVFPVSGQPLPLISKGGISVITTSLAFGIMLSVARHAVRITDTQAEQRQERDILPENARSVNPSLDVNK